MPEFVLVLVGSVGFLLGFICARMSARTAIVTVHHTVQPIEGRWIDLPSGFSCEYGPGFVGYVSPTDDGAYWWLARRGRTIIEGPASTVGLGKVQVEQAAAEFKF